MGDGTDGDINGWYWHPGESDAKATNSGWFYHDGESPLSAERLFQMYLETVGRNATLILNVPPNKAGVLPAADVKVLEDLGKMIEKRLGTDLAKTAKVEASETRAPGAKRTYGVNKTNAQLQKVVSEGQAALDGGFTGCEMSVFNGQTADNSWYAYAQSREYTGCSSTVEKLLTERNDPREPIYNYDKWGKNVVANPGDDALASESEYVNWPAYLDNGAASLHLMSLSELNFVMAEAKARLGENAEDNFKAGVEASVKDFFAAGGSVIERTISATQISDYLTAIQARYTANPLKEILIQKYIAQTRDEQLETYADIRRCRFIDGSYPVAMTNPNNTAGGANRWPLCLPYGDSDVKSNPNVAKAFGTGNDAGMYVYTNNVWWAGGQ